MRITCQDCSVSFHQRTGRPARRCTACRGKYDAAFRKLRDTTKAAAVGTPCRRCGRPMDDPAAMDLGHDDATGEVAGWEHAQCNRSAGARKGNAMRRGTAAQAAVPASRPPKPDDGRNWAWCDVTGEWCPSSGVW
ncbi:hypothetical protein L7D48_26455 [Streptomyces sp. S1A]|uniref:hypothetical protein n=1 Tax=Streptomyces sp. ICN903 TaxID=2964654 RepID=UPI001EDC180E|nr:hypothetical protein [Streptomyces sp. ICN903]MCG3044077.1 hypothetical protein [Streptomyces sp. ICN903]